MGTTTTVKFLSRNTLRKAYVTLFVLLVFALIGAITQISIALDEADIERFIEPIWDLFNQSPIF